MDTQATATQPSEKTTEQISQENQVAVITTIERLFRAVNEGSFPLRVHDDVLAGMNFMSQFHKQLVSQLPPEVVEQAKRRNAPVAEAPNADSKA